MCACICSAATSQLFDSSVLIAVDLKKAEEIEDTEFRKKTLAELRAMDRSRSTLIQLCRQLYIDQKYVRAFMHAWCTSQPAECMQCICVAGSAFYGHRLKPSDALIHGTRRATAYV
jgi:hypothetical protein